MKEDSWINKKESWDLISYHIEQAKKMKSDEEFDRISNLSYSDLDPNMDEDYE